MSPRHAIAAAMRRILARWMRQPGEPRIFVSQRQAGVLVDEDSALTSSAVWACVRFIAETIATMPWHVYRRTDTGREQVDNAVAWLIGTRPTSELTSVTWRETIIAHALTWGNGYAHVERDQSGRPIALPIITPDRCRPMRLDDGSLVYVITSDDGSIDTVPARDLFHLHGLGFDGVVGYSPVRMAARSVGLTIAQDSFAQAFFANGTTFGSIVEVPATLRKDQIEEQEAYLNERHGGPDAAFRAKVVPAGVKVTPLGMPMTDAQFLESRRFSVNEIARWYRVPPHKIGDLERSTNNNIEQQAIEAVSDCLMPWVRRLEAEADAKLFGGRSQGTLYTRIQTAALMRGDAKTRAEYYRTMISMGAMSINEVRALEELNGIGPDGDEHLVQLNQTTLERMVEGADAGTSGAAGTTPAADPGASDRAAQADTAEPVDPPAPPADAAAGARQRARADTLRLLHGGKAQPPHDTRARA